MSKESKRKKKTRMPTLPSTRTVSRAKHPAEKPKMKNKQYEAELFKLQVELVKLQNWAKKSGARTIIVFEGRDAAGKGGITNVFWSALARVSSG